MSAGQLLQSADHIKGGTLAAAGGPKQANQSAVGNFKIEIIDGDHFFIGFLVAAGEDLGHVF